jgi:predicted tellurium resistance membrane protein TerC
MEVLEHHQKPESTVVIVFVVAVLPVVVEENLSFDNIVLMLVMVE